MPINRELFTITEEHIKLLRHTFFEWNHDSYGGAPCVDVKRPYGNSGGVQYDIAEILGLVPNPNYKPDEYDWKEKYTPEQVKHCLKLHRDMEKVFQVICSTATVSIGIYYREGTDVYDDTAWKVLVP